MKLFNRYQKGKRNLLNQIIKNVLSSLNIWYLFLIHQRLMREKSNQQKSSERKQRKLFSHWSQNTKLKKNINVLKIYWITTWKMLSYSWTKTAAINSCKKSANASSICCFDNNCKKRPRIIPFRYWKTKRSIHWRKSSRSTLLKTMSSV